MTFSVLKHTRFLPTAFCTILLFQRIPPLFHETLLSNSYPPLLHPPRCIPCIEPRPAKFLHTVCQRFCQPSEPCSDPCFLLFNGQWRGGAGGGVKCERVESMFNQELTPIGPHPNFILFNPLHCYKKFIHAAGDHHWSRQKYTAGPHKNYVVDRDQWL